MTEPSRAAGPASSPGSAPARKRGRGTVLGAALAVAVVAAGVGLVAGDRRAAAPAAGGVGAVDEVAVTATDLRVEPSNNSPLIVADPDDPLFVVMANRLDAPDFGCALQVSGDGGRTWLTADPVRQLPPGADKCYAPEVDFGPDGALHYLFVGLKDAGNEPTGAFIVTSRDRGVTFSAPQPVLGPHNFAVRMAVDRTMRPNGRIHLAWIAASSDPPLGGFGPPPNPILTAHSDDGGHSFSPPVQVSDPARQRVVAPALALGPDHAVHVAYIDLGADAIDYQGLEGPVWEEPWSIVLASSFDAGRRFSTGRVVDGEIRAAERVMLVFTMPAPALVAGSDGLVCVAWTDARHGDPDALSRCSHDRGGTWAPARRLNDDRPGNGVTQYLPRLALSPAGRLDAVFFDRRDGRRNVANHVYLTYSTDGGRRFAPNHRISGEASNTRIGQQYVHPAARGQFEIGSRLGLLSRRSGAVAAWPDTRHSSVGTTSQDLFSATVALSQPRSATTARRWVGAALVMAGLGAFAAALRRRLRRPPEGDR